MKILFIAMLISFSASAAPVDGVRPEPKREKGLFLLPRVKPESKMNPKDIAPALDSPATHEVKEPAPEISLDEDLRRDFMVSSAVPDKSCHVMYADLLKVRRLGKPAIATAIALPTATIAALAAKAGYESILKAEERDSTRFRAKSKEEVIAEAQSYLKNRFYSSRRLFGDYLNKDFSFGQWLLAGEFAQNGGDPKDFADAGAAYAGMVKMAEEIKKSNLPFLEKIQAIRRLALENPGVLSGYCSGLSTLNDALLHHCGNCEASMKTYISLLHDAGIEMEPPYELGIQVFSDHVQPVLRNTENGYVIDLDSGNTATELRESIFRPELLFYGYLKGQEADAIVDRQKDLLLAELPTSADVIEQDFEIKTDTFFNFGGGRSASSDRPPPDFGKRKMSENKLGKPEENEKGLSANRYGKRKPKKNSKGGPEMDGPFGDDSAETVSVCESEAVVDRLNSHVKYQEPGFVTTGAEVQFDDPAKRKFWNESTALERWSYARKMIANEFSAIERHPGVKKGVAAMAKGRAPGIPVPKELLGLGQIYGSLVNLGHNLLNCIDESELPFSKERAKREFVAHPFMLMVEDIYHRRSAEIADDPMAEIRRLKKMKPAEILELGDWSLVFRYMLNDLAPDSLNKERKEFGLMSGNKYFRSPAGSLYEMASPFASLYRTLADRKKVEVAEEGAKVKPMYDDGIEVPTTSLAPGDYEAVVVLPKNANAKSAPITIPAETMSAILNIEATRAAGKNYGASQDLLNVKTWVADRFTPDVAAAAAKLKTSYNLSFLELPYDQLEALRSIPSMRDAFRENPKLWQATIFPQAYKGEKNSKPVYEKSTNPMFMVYRDGHNGLKNAASKKLLEFDGSVSDEIVTPMGQFSVKVSGQVMSGLIQFDPSKPRGPVTFAFGPLVWVCEKSCDGEPSLKALLNDPKMRKLKFQLEQHLDPSLLGRLKKLGVI